MQTPGTSGTDTGNPPPFNPVTEPPDSGTVDPDLQVADPDLALEPDAEDAAAQEAQAHEAEAQPEARKHGWVPREEWRGPPERWRPASEFMEVRNGMLNVAREENSQLRAKLAVLEGRLNTREQAENEARTRLTRESLRLELKNARENQDWDKVDEITEKLLDSKIAAVAPPPQQVQIAPEVKETFDNFTSTNKWLVDDKRLAANFAIELKAVIEAKATGDMHTAMELAKDRVMRMYPDKFRSSPTRRNGSSMVDMGGTPGGTSNGRSWSDLPIATQRMAAEDIKAKRYTKEEFLANCSAEDFRR